jgi:hypothetical protein
MDFDHVAGEKVDDICGMRMRTVARDRAEIEKCEVVCANCHRARTHMRRLGLQVRPSAVMQRFGEDYVSVLLYAGNW